jgi:hypothetical protein
MAQRHGRRQFLQDGGKAALALAAWRATRVESAPAFDLVVHGGTLLDGTGGPAFAARGSRAGAPSTRRACTSRRASSTSTPTRTSASPPTRLRTAACGKA